MRSRTHRCKHGLLALAFFVTLLKSSPTSAAEEVDRYQPCDPASFAVPRQTVTRKDYVDYVRPAAKGFESGPDRGTYGPRHAMPALAVFALEGDPRLGEGIKKTLRHYADWVHATIAKEGGVFSMEGATLCSLHFRELRRRGLMTPDDEAWAKKLLLALCRHQCAWRPGDGLWRGSHHRSQCQGINHALAAASYPDEPEAAQWRSYSQAVWGDWWNYRDVGINDTGYYYSSFVQILRAADLLGKKEVFADPQSRQLFDRIVDELPPSGAAIPYGSSGGYHAAAGTRIYALELAARYTRDGRYRWAAHRLMNYGQARGFSSTHHHLNAMALEEIASASLVCDDSVAPVEPDGGSRLLMRKEIVRLNDKQAKEMFPDAGGIDCNMFMTQRTLPSKLAFRSGWAPDDLYMLVECYVRHDPLNPTAIVGMEQHSAAFAEMTSEKFVSRENAVHIQDISGTASFLGQKPFRGKKNLPVGYAGMECSVPAFADHRLATHARVLVTNYMGYRAAQEREILFVKNRFVLIRDETAFDDAFRAKIGPVWNTGRVGTPQGANWVNTWFAGHYFQKAKLYDVPPRDLLVWHSPRPERKIEIITSDDNPQSGVPMLSTRFVWEGEVAPGQRLQFVQVLLPHAPVRDATALAGTIKTLLDRPGTAAVSIATGSRLELAAVNSSGEPMELATEAGKVTTDAKALYLELRDGKPTGFVMTSGTRLRLNETDLCPASTDRGDFEKP